jgi:hypothetical protein
LRFKNVATGALDFFHPEAAELGRRVRAELQRRKAKEIEERFGVRLDEDGDTPNSRRASTTLERLDFSPKPALNEEQESSTFDNLLQYFVNVEKEKDKIRREINQSLRERNRDQVSGRETLPRSVSLRVTVAESQPNKDQQPPLGLAAPKGLLAQANRSPPPLPPTRHSIPSTGGPQFHPAPPPPPPPPPPAKAAHKSSLPKPSGARPKEQLAPSQPTNLMEELRKVQQQKGRATQPTQENVGDALKKKFHQNSDDSW